MKIWVALADMALVVREAESGLRIWVGWFIIFLFAVIYWKPHIHTTHIRLLCTAIMMAFFFFFVFSVFSSLIRATTNTEIVWQSFSFCLLVFFLWLLFFKLCAILWRNAISFGFFLWSYFARTRIPQRRLLNICVCRWIEFLFCIHCTNLHMAFYEHSPVHTNTDRVRWRTGDCVPYVCVSEYNLINKFL